MRLCYYKSANFGDALNPYIFNTLLPGFFDDDLSIDFYGIGSIVGWTFPPEAERKIIFSSGFAYGSKPEIDSRYDVICVRGPLTARALGLAEELAVVDGAVLLKHWNFASRAIKHEYSFIPHWESERRFNWKWLCEQAGVNYISPTAPFLDVIDNILKSKTILAEAMHGAIVADSLRVPWIPVTSYRGVTTFKWDDWASSLRMKYEPIAIPPLYADTAFTRKLCTDKIGRGIPAVIYGLGLKAYEGIQSLTTLPKALKALETAKKSRSYLSEDKLLNQKYGQLLEKLEGVRAKYR